jgi:hypothetical protein
MKNRVVKNQRTPNKAGSGSLSMERAPGRVSAERQGVEGTTEEMGAGECTQTPGAPAAGRSAAPTRLRDKCALPHGNSDVPLMA